MKLNVSQLLLHLEIENRDFSELTEERTTMQTQAENLQVQLYCGAGEWHRVAYLNMSDPSEQCPSVWVEYVSHGIRVCKRPTSPGGSCPGKVYSINRLTDTNTARCVKGSWTTNSEAQMDFQ